MTNLYIFVLIVSLFAAFKSDRNYTPLNKAYIFVDRVSKYIKNNQWRQLELRY